MTMHLNSRFCFVILFITIICCLILPNRGTAQNSHINSPRKTFDIARTERSRLNPLQLGPIIDDFQVNDNLGGCRHSHPSVEFDGYKNYVIAWQDNRNDNGDIYAQRYDQNGVALGENFRVSDDMMSRQYTPAVAVDEWGQFIVTWGDNRNGPDIYAQKYSKHGNPLGGNFKITSTNDSWQFSPDVGLWKDKMISTWSSNAAGGTGFDIWANVWEWTYPINVDEYRGDTVPETWFLQQNVPNPFNPVTTIEFGIPRAGQVEVQIYNLNGEKVRLLTREYFNAGKHRTIWNGRDDRGAVVPSGIYFIRILSSRYSKTIKATLLQ